MKTIFRSKNGFSLVELIITLVLLVILVSLGYLVISAGNDNFDKGSAKAHLQQNSRLLDEHIQNNMRTASNIVITSVEADMLENRLGIVDREAISNGIELTAAVIDDFQIKVDGGGDRPVMEYIIYASFEEETFELRNSIVLNNLPSSYFGGSYTDFTSIGSLKMSYNADLNIPQVRKLTITPDFVVRGRTFAEDAPAVFEIYVENDTFKDLIDTMDVSPFEGIALLLVKDVVKDNDTHITVSLYSGGPVTDTVGTGKLTIFEEGLEGEGDLTVSIDIIDPDIDYIEIIGETDIVIPDSGTTSSTYNIVAYDTEGREITNESAIWSLESPIDGVSIDGNTGVLTVDYSASVVTVTIEARSSRNELKDDTFAVNLVTAEQSLEDLMNQAVLRYVSGYSDKVRPTFLTVDSIEGVTFYFSEADSVFSITGENDEKVEIFARKDDVTGTIKMVGYRGSEYWVKEFSVFVGKNKQSIVITEGSVYPYTP